MRQALYALLFSSGAAGLAYEICWSRQLGVWVGHSERATALTLALFFLGMAGGYAFAARASQRPLRAMRAYALCELAIAACALCVPWLHQYPSWHALLWLALLPPTFAMGASLPFIMQAVGQAGTGASLARAYAIHLLGATLGSLVTTFVLIEQLGLWHTTYLAAAVSASCGASAWFLAAPEPTSSHVQPAPAQPAPAFRFQLAAAWAGAATLALQVLVLRLFALTFHNSTYTFGLTLSVFIVFLALGSRWVAKRESTGQHTGSNMPARGAALAALGVLCIVPLFALVTRFGELRAAGFVSYMLLAAGLVVSVLALPVAAAGSLLPALWSRARGSAGHTVGTLSAANSIGAAAGALLASFVLLEGLGLLGALSCVSIAYAALSLTLSGWNRFSAPLLAALLLLAVWGQGYEPGSPPGYALLERWQTPYGWVDLLRSHDQKHGALSARLDLHYQLGSSADRERHVAMGSLPLALHPDPKRVLFIGLATGMTASAALTVPSVEQIEVVELIPEVVELARRFSDHNAHLLDDARVQVVIEDGRTYVQRTSLPFDVIVADLFVPWHSHAGYLYTVEHYRAVRRGLRASGIFAQWLPLWQLGSDELELIGESLVAAFAHTSVWLDDSDPARALLAIVGHRQPASVPTQLGAARWLGAFPTRQHALLNSDQYPRVEFRAPRSERDQRLLTGATLRAYLAQRFGPAAKSAREL